VSTDIEDGEEFLTGSEAKIALAMKEENSVQRSAVSAAVTIPAAPFWGAKVADAISLKEVYRYINEAALIKGQWQVRKGKRTEEEYRRQLEEQVYPELERLKAEAEKEMLLQPRAVYGYFPCNSDGNDLIIIMMTARRNERGSHSRDRRRTAISACRLFRCRCIRQKRRRCISYGNNGKAASEHSANSSQRTVTKISLFSMG